MMSFTRLHIQALTLRDLDLVMRFDRAIFEPDAQETREVYEDRLRLCPEGCFQLLQGDEPIGYLMSEVWDTIHNMPLNQKASVHHNPKGDKVMVTAFGIRPEFQGQGAGTFFFLYFIEEMRKRGFASIILRPASKAKPLYSRLGFVKIGEGKDTMENYEIMELKLQKIV